MGSFELCAGNIKGSSVAVREEDLECLAGGGWLDKWIKKWVVGD